MVKQTQFKQMMASNSDLAEAYRSKVLHQTRFANLAIRMKQKPLVIRMEMETHAHARMTGVLTPDLIRHFMRWAEITYEEALDLIKWLKS